MTPLLLPAPAAAASIASLIARRCVTSFARSSSTSQLARRFAARTSSDVGMTTTDVAVLVPASPVLHRDDGMRRNVLVSHSERTHVMTSSSAAARRFSSSPSPPPPPTMPSSISVEAGLGAQDAMKFYIVHGLGKERLRSISSDDHSSPFVDRWQRMISCYLEAQCHVMGLLGYPPDERGISLYTQHVQTAMSMSPPDAQERLRVSMRDTYRHVLAGAFDMPDLLDEMKGRGEMSIMEARDVMHKVSLRMLDRDILDKVRERCGDISSSSSGTKDVGTDLARRHTVVQEVMVADVYLSPSSSSSKAGDGKGGEGSTTTLVEEFGFGSGESGYVRMQCALAEHQGDPLITQYVGAAIVKLLDAAGIDMEAMQKQARELQQQ